MNIEHLKKKVDRMKTDLAIKRKEKTDLEEKLEEYGIMDFSNANLEIKTLTKKMASLKKTRDDLLNTIQEKIKGYENA